MQVQVGTYIQHDLQVTWPNFGEIGQRSRSHRHIMYTAKICLNSVPRGPINFILGCWHQDHPATSGAQNSCHGNVGWLTTRQLNMNIMASYFKYEDVHKLPNRHIYSSSPPGHVTQFWGIGQRSRSHWHIMYTDKICHNSVLSDHIIFILRSLATFEPTHNYLGTNCLPCQRQLPRNGAKNYGLMISLITYCSIANISSWCTYSQLLV